MKCSRECVKPASNKGEEDWAEGRLEARLEARAAVVVAYSSAVGLEAGLVVVAAVAVVP
jgi:hypothetical protein